MEVFFFICFGGFLFGWLVGICLRSAKIWSWSCSRDFSWDVSHWRRVDIATIRPPLLFLPLVFHDILRCVFWILTLTATSVLAQQKSQRVDMKNVLLLIANILRPLCKVLLNVVEKTSCLWSKHVSLYGGLENCFSTAAFSIGKMLHFCLRCHGLVLCQRERGGYSQG